MKIRNEYLKIVLAVIGVCLPHAMRKWMYGNIFGYSIHPTAYLGRSVILVDSLRMDQFSRIGHLTVAKGLSVLDLKMGGRLGNLNWVTGFPLKASGSFADQPERVPKLTICKFAAVTHRHLIDCTDSITIGEYSTIAGWGTQILTHGIDISECRQRSGPIYVGKYSFIGTRSVLLKGVRIADYTVVGAGSVVSGDLLQEYTLYGGVPARQVKSLDEDSGYFRRSEGGVR